MKVVLYVCFILFVTDGATGQTSDPVCVNIGDFNECNTGNGKCDEKISKCICFEEQPFCRCNSKKGEFYIDENCSQRWTVTTFALVASLPGLTLAVLVGVIVYVLMLSSQNSHTGEEMTTHNTASREQDLFPGITFASDMNGRPPANLRPVQQDHTPMTAMSSRPYSPSSSVYQSAVKTDGRPRETNSMYNGMRDPPMGAPVQPYSTGAGRGQIVSNPYARDPSSQNPYEGDHQDYRPQAPSHTYEDLTQNRPYAPAPAPLYSSEHGNLRNGFPRPQLNLQY
ncbi:uncharacterized protein zgc:158432 isoform X2 [Megalobrama amblycephala]|uniref:uncharacterized protein zgc:158432 isoform X2 n=1 Tax=Megalobrama amblycephala TaxID=75352 RepID=UPI00201418EF|nr:uncharacterized protein zgc:158432 isoform X2 [Megalobrama amblycephala]